MQRRETTLLEKHVMKQSADTKNVHTVPWVTVGLSLFTVLLYLFYDAAPEALIYDRFSIAQGEFWRLFSGHFVHCDTTHLGWNLAAFFILGGLLERRLGTGFLKVVGVSCLGVSGWLWFVKSNLILYCGLSGMLNGLLAVLLFVLWRELKHPLLLIIGIMALLKITLETASGQAIFTDLSWASVPGAHGAGMAAGLLYNLISMAREGNFFGTTSKRWTI